jgi:hypothetical protein
VRHDQTVTWLAYWQDTIRAKEYKYVFLGATSRFKANSDLEKYEKVRGSRQESLRVDAGLDFYGFSHLGVGVCSS